MNGILENPQPMTVLTDKGSFEFTPKTELAELLIKCKNSAIRKGELRPFTIDDGLKALEEERAGYDGLGRLWGKSESTLTQV